MKKYASDEPHEEKAKCVVKYATSINEIPMNKRTVLSLLVVAVMILAALAGYFFTRPKRNQLATVFSRVPASMGSRRTAFCVVTECKRKTDQ